MRTMRVSTQNSVYYVDFKNMCACRESGNADPTDRFGADNEWHTFIDAEILDVHPFGKALLIHWDDESPTHTLTSDLVSYEDLGEI